MTVIRSCFWLVAIFEAARLLGSPALAQQSRSAAAGPFERGAQAYLAGNDAEAERLLAQATRADPHDPRPYYFRALCLLRQGHPVAARANMLIGAELESRSGGSYPVGDSLRSLPRVDRLTLDEFRWRAGTTTHANAEEGQSRRLIATDAAVLRHKVSVRLDQLVQPVSLNELVSASTTQPATAANEANRPLANDPFADDHPAAPQGKIPSGKLIGIVGRVLLKSTPVESLDALREKVANVPLPGAAPVPATTSGAGSDHDVAPADDDPFAEPNPPPAQQQYGQPATDVDDEDPFG